MPLLACRESMGGLSRLRGRPVMTPDIRKFRPSFWRSMHWLLVAIALNLLALALFWEWMQELKAP
jgi:hypothetical protein